LLPKKNALKSGDNVELFQKGNVADRPTGKRTNIGNPKLRS
jgi:hypothetical protein